MSREKEAELLEEYAKRSEEGQMVEVSEIKAKYCGCQCGVWPFVLCRHVREYRYAYGTVELVTGESFFLSISDCNTACMNVFLEKLSEGFPADIILFCCDGDSWHKSKDMVIPSNIILLYIPPCTPETRKSILQTARKRDRIGHEKANGELRGSKNDKRI